MKYLVPLALVILSSCGSAGNKNTPAVADVDSLSVKINNYAKSKTNNPDKYEPGRISTKELVTKPLLISECYYNKYAPKEIDFDKPSNFKAPEVNDIHEKFYSVVNEFKAQNNFGAIVKYSMVLYLDSADNIISSMTF